MDAQYTLDIINARHERAEFTLCGIILAQLAAIVLLVLWGRKHEKS